MDRAKWGTNCWYTLVEETTFHNAGSSAGFNIALKREGEKIKTKMENKLYISYLITHPSIDIAELGLMYQSIPKPPIPPGQSPGIWLALSSVQRGIWPKMRPARWSIWLACQNVCQRSEAKGFRNSLIQQVSRVHESLLLSIPRGFFCCCRFI